MKKIVILVSFLMISVSLSANTVHPSDSTSFGFGSFLQSLFGGSSSSSSNSAGTQKKDTTTTVAPSSPLTSTLGSVLSGTVSSATSSQSAGDLVSNVLGTLLGQSSALLQANLTGTWNYKGAACVLESDNALTNIGGTLVTSKLETKMDEYLSKIGIKSGACSFTFNTDNTCTFTVAKRTISGVYALDAENKTIQFTFANVLSMTAYVAYTGSSLQLVFNVDKLMSLIKKVSSSLSANATISTINTLLSAYDGMMIGVKLEK